MRILLEFKDDDPVVPDAATAYRECVELLGGDI